MTDTRNIIDYYRYWKTEAIKADLDSKRHNFSVLISNKFHDFNCGSVIRNANAFLAKNVFIFGRSQIDRRGAVGTMHYENIKKVKFVEDLDFKSYNVVGVDNIPEAKPVENYNWNPDKHTLMVFGQEDIGIPDELKAICEDFVYIKQYGSVRSLNVGVASGIVMYSYCLQNGN